MKKKNKRKARRWLIFSLALLAVLFAVAFIGPSLIPHQPFKPNMRNALQPPSAEYLFGTDNLGRCVFCRVIAGASTSLFSALAVVGIVFAAGTVLGVAAGFTGGVLDHIIMKISLIFQAFPSFILAVAVAGILGNGLKNGIISLCAVYWVTYCRLARSLTVSLRDMPYIRAARICGAGKISILFKYVLPNVVAPVLVTAALDVGSVILSMAGLSFLGLGAVRPTAEWGAVMSEAKDYLQTAPWIIVFNGAALFVVVTIFNLFGDSLRDVLDTNAEI
ncbi:MAG: ABC transporter permease [Lachnospiraceae bacterium]|nr:ABC transporter permease [Lachnospiraceae bacterium]